MYDIRQFRFTLYIVALLGITGYCFGAEMPGLWLLSMLAIGLNMWLVRSGRFRPMPHFVANLATVIILGWCILSVRSGMKEILAVGQFLVLMHLIKFYEQRLNRDYAQILVLSLLLMVAASITSVTLFFGLVLACYLLMALYCCLLFHLKTEADIASAAMTLDRPLPAQVLRQDQRRLSRSMRRVTGLVAVVSISAAVVVFVLFPRGAGAGMFGNLRLNPKQAMSGFSEQTSFSQIEQLTQNREVIAHLQLSRGGVVQDTPREILLRGNVMDVYSGKDSVSGASWQWSRSPALDQSMEAFSATSDGPSHLSMGLTDPDSPQLRQRIRLEPTGTQVLFAIAGATTFQPIGRELRIRLAPVSSTLYSNDRLDHALDYEVVSTGVLPQPDESILTPASQPVMPDRNYRGGVYGWTVVRPPRTVSNIDPRIKDYALKPEVSGSDENGPLAPRRPLNVKSSELDEQIADNIQSHLRTSFLYSTDLTGTRTDVNEDPMVTFLYTSRKGYCGYFASAMTLMCQSMGLQARYVVGFKTGTEYSKLTGSFVVRQTDAHAWVEVLLPNGYWKTYDPTSGQVADEEKSQSWWLPIQHVLDYLELKWSDAVVNYDSDARQNVINNVESGMARGSMQGASWFEDLGNWSSNLWLSWSQGVLGFLMVVLVLALAVAVGWFLRERLRLRRVAARIGLKELPASERLRLARQLGFYDELVQSLDDIGLRRKSYQTPEEFSDSLTFLPAEAYQGIRRITAMFYRIRFGQRTLQPAQIRRLQRVIDRLQESLAARTVRVR